VADNVPLKGNQTKKGEKPFFFVFSINGT